MRETLLDLGRLGRVENVVGGRMGQVLAQLIPVAAAAALSTVPITAMIPIA